MAMLPNAALTGVFPMPVDGASRNAPPSNEDIARVAVGALVHPEKHAGKVYRPTGPICCLSMKWSQSSAASSDGTFNTSRPMWMFNKAARLAGQSAHLLSVFPHYVREHNTGAFGIGAPTNHVFEVSGQQPENFETIARRYAALPQSRQTFGNTMKAFATLTSVPLRPGVDPHRYEVDHDFPMPPAPRYDIDDQRWKIEHASAVAAANVLPNSIRSSSASSIPAS